MPRLGVLGWPVAHSRSPAMHNAALAAMGLEGTWRYQLLPVPPEHLTETIAALGAAGFAGANVTIPHKEAALAAAGTATDAARAIGAANTLTFGPGGAVAADNTDAPAVLGAVVAAGGGVAGRSVLVLGAGGSARAAAWALAGAGAEVAVWNRSADRARALASDLGVAVADVPRAADVLVHCTSVGLDGADAAAVLGLGDLSAYGTVVDLVYASGGTPLVRAARAAGCATVDGLEVLARQGALSLQAWTGRAAPLEVMRAAAAG